jgi:hypothetical protein
MVAGRTIPVEVATPVQPPRPESIFSCPAGIGNPQQQKEKGGVGCKEGDCLPEDTLVYVDGSPMPQPLCTVTATQRLLCYDDLVGSVGYVPVERVTISEPKVQPDRGAVRVQLLDNTELEMTGNHPVKTYPILGNTSDANVAVGTGVQGSGRFAQAADLQAGYDSLMVLKTVAVPVRKVEQVPLEDASNEERRWVTITVQGPQRHTIFTATKGNQLAPCQMMAVGGSNLQPLHQGRPSQKHTFIHFYVADDSEGVSSRHTASAPPTFAPTMEAQGSVATEPAALLQPDDEVVSNLSTIVSMLGDTEETAEDNKAKLSLSSLTAAAVAASCGNRRRQQQRARRREGRIAQADNADSNDGNREAVCQR